MSLVLTFREGEDFYVGDRRVVVGSIVSETKVILERGDGGESVTLSDEEQTELFQDVFVRVGLRGQNRMARIAFKAPDEIKIFSGANYRSGARPKR